MNITMLYGKSVDHWCDVAMVMEEYNIKDASELSNRLSYNAPIKTPVYDGVNRKRLLGHMIGIDRTLRESAHRGRTIHFACVEPGRAYAFNTNLGMESVRFDRVTFEIDRYTEDGGWTYSPILLSYDPLKLLLKLDKFRLPDETEHQWSCRFLR